MKKILLIAALVAATATASAQFYVEGAIGYKQTKAKDAGDLTDSKYTVAPAVGYYLNDRFDVGVGLDLCGAKFEQGEGEAKQNDWSVAPFARYSFLQLGKFEVLAKLAVNYGQGKVDVTDEMAIKYSQFGVNLTPILAFNVCERIVLTTQLNFMSLGYNVFKDRDGDGKYTNFNIGVDSRNVITTGGARVPSELDVMTNPAMMFDAIINSGMGITATPGITVGFAYKF